MPAARSPFTRKLTGAPREQPGIYSGEHVKWPKTRTFTAKKVDVSSDARVLLDLDGEQPGVLPATFEVVPGAIALRA